MDWLRQVEGLGAQGRRALVLSLMLVGSIPSKESSRKRGRTRQSGGNSGSLEGASLEGSRQQEQESELRN